MIKNLHSFHLLSPSKQPKWVQRLSFTCSRISFRRVPDFLFIEEVLRVKTLSYLTQLILGRFPATMDSSFMHTANSSVCTEVTGRLIKSPLLSGKVSTRTGRLFRVERSVYGKGMLMISPGSTFIPYPVFFVVPDMIHNRILGIFKILDLFVLEPMLFFNVFYKIKDFPCQVLRKHAPCVRIVDVT